MNRIEILLKQYGPMLSGDLAKKYEKKSPLENSLASLSEEEQRNALLHLSLLWAEKKRIS